MKDNFHIAGLHLNRLGDDEVDFIPLMSAEDEDRMNKVEVPAILPVLPIRNTVLFPGVVIPITVGRDKSIKLIKDANKGDKIIGVVAQKDDTVEDPEFSDLNKIGTLANIIKMLRMPDGSTTVIIQGKKKFELNEPIQIEPYLKATVSPFDDKVPHANDPEFLALISSLKDISIQIIKESPNIPTEASIAVKNIETPGFLINFICSNMNTTVQEKQRLLEIADLKERATKVLEALNKELQLLELKNQIQSKVKTDIDRQQREYFLHQQMKTIQEELGGPNSEQELNELKEKAAKKKWDNRVADFFKKECDKLQRINQASAEYSVQMNYLENLVELPWNEYSKDRFDLRRGKKILDRDHYGMEKIKDRIIEHLAVLKLKGNMKAPILLLHGPPGVGKTSLGKSIAESLGRKYVRMSLGGLRDEAEIRGHRKTYIGAMPGRIIQNLKKAGTANPVFILDEIDKLSRDFSGDPSSALLEVLDPEQNNSFYDNYIEQEFDLSKVMFIATCNTLNTIQPALLDRMEVVDITGYLMEEKVEIAKRHLIPKQIEEHGLKKSHITFTKEAIEKIVGEYTRESGVRNLEKKIAKVVRVIARKVATGEKFVNEIHPEDVQTILGAGITRDRYQNNHVAGVVTGLAWTAVGGEILFIESVLSRGKGKMSITGNLGDVMKESATLALEWIKANANELLISAEVFENYNIHIHVPEGATPKDGPSAGITMLTALSSLLTQRKVKSHLAMTGEITLRGKVLPVGGIKEKILAAKRADIKEIILCVDNKRDVDEINADYLKGIKFHFVDNMNEVLKIALLNEKVENALF
jgi:ATP-dependent Lon protease